MSFLRDLTLSPVERVAIENLTTGDLSPAVALAPDGRFTGTVPVVPGRNDVLVTATATDGRERRREFTFDYANPADRQRLLEDERERIRKQKQWRKELEIGAETGPAQRDNPESEPAGASGR